MGQSRHSNPAPVVTPIATKNGSPNATVCHQPSKRRLLYCKRKRSLRAENSPRMFNKSQKDGLPDSAMSCSRAVRNTCVFVRSTRFFDSAMKRSITAAKEWIFFRQQPVRLFEFGFAFDDPGIGSLFAAEGFRLAVDGDAAFLDDDLCGEGFGAVFASSSYYWSAGTFLLSYRICRCCTHVSRRIRSVLSARHTTGARTSRSRQSVQSLVFGYNFNLGSTTPPYHRCQNRSKSAKTGRKSVRR
jgi:hypothetical protein